MRFAQFMASGAGRGLRVAAGIIAIVAGIAVLAMKGSVILGVVLLADGALFAVVWPAWLVVLAVRVRVPFPAVQAPLFGLVLTVAAWRSWASVWRASSGAATGCR